MSSSPDKPRIVLIGRPNVGKSTLFNRMAGKKLAIVNNTPGVTRDWREADTTIMGHPIKIIDTAGLEESFDESIQGRMRRQTEQAMDQCDLAVFMVDGRAGITPMDHHFARFIRKYNVPVLLVINKCEGSRGIESIGEAYSLGLGTPIPVSAEHNEGIGILYDAIIDHCKDLLPKASNDDDDGYDSTDTEIMDRMDIREGDLGFDFTTSLIDDDTDKGTKHPIKIAVVGRPNAGKSTLVNTLLQMDRVMTGPEPGVTRDAIAVDWEWNEQPFILVDTAGLRKRTKVTHEIEQAASTDTYRSVRLAQVVILVLDGTLTLDKQDLAIAAHVIEEGRILIIAINKWDIITEKNDALQSFQDRLQRSLAQLPDVPVVTVSALKNKRIDTLMQSVMDTYGNWNKRVSTGPLNRWLYAMERHHPAPLTQNRPNRLRYITQIKSRPPTFAVWVSKPQDIPDSYKRYLMNNIRTDFGMSSVPIRLVLRTSKNPYNDN